MKQTKHTLGPWDTSRYHYPYRDIVQRIGEDDNDAFSGSRLICRVNSDNPNYKANARLIAAAPELLEACKLLYKAWEELIPCLKNSVVQDYGLVLTTAPLKAKTAIAKAEGK